MAAPMGYRPVTGTRGRPLREGREWVSEGEAVLEELSIAVLLQQEGGSYLWRQAILFRTPFFPQPARDRHGPLTESVDCGKVKYWDRGVPSSTAEVANETSCSIGGLAS